MKIKIEGLYFNYGISTVLRNINMEALPGEITAIIGPNAAGKTTLLKCIAGILRSSRRDGKIFFNEKEINDFRKGDINRFVSYFPQENSVHAVLQVFEVVLLGRLHSMSWRVRNEELSLVSKVIEDFGIEDLASRYINELSGGQRQMVFVAQSLVREPKILLLDEPTNNLDLQHQLEVLDLVRHVTIEQNITTIVALHDLNLAARYADKFIVMREGNVYSAGKPIDVITQEMVRTIYNVNAYVYIDNDGVPQVIPKSSTKNDEQISTVKEEMKIEMKY